MDKEKKYKVKGIFGTLLFHALLLFLLSLSFMSLDYEDPPTRKGGGSISIAMNLISEDEEEPETATTSKIENKETLENKDLNTSDNGEIDVSDNKTKETEEVPDDKEKLEELTQEQKDIIKLKKKLKEVWNRDKNDEEWEWSPIINSTEKGKGDWFKGESEGKDGTKFGVKGGTRGVQIKIPKGRVQQDNEVIETTPFEIWIDVKISPDGNVNSAIINPNKSTIGYKSHHKKRSEEAAKLSVFTEIPEEEGEQVGYMIFTYKLTGKEKK